MVPRSQMVDRQSRRSAGGHPAGRDRVRPLALSGDRRGPRPGRRHPARQGPAALFRGRRPRGLRHQGSAAPGRVHSGEQAPQRAAEGIPRQPQPHGDRGRRVRRRRRAWSRSRTCSSRSSATSTTSTTSTTISTSARKASASSPSRRRRASTSSTAIFGTEFSDEEFDTIGGLVDELPRPPAAARRVVRARRAGIQGAARRPAPARHAARHHAARHRAERKSEAASCRHALGDVAWRCPSALPSRSLSLRSAGGRSRSSATLISSLAWHDATPRRAAATRLSVHGRHVSRRHVLALSQRLRDRSCADRRSRCS